jgi:hypothetical protein
MRREKRLAENEERYRAEQDRRRAKRKMNSLLLVSHDSSDGSAVRRATREGVNMKCRPPSLICVGR